MVMLRCGRIDDAVACARKTLQEDIIARCLLVHSRVVMPRIGEEIPKQGVIDNLEEAVGLFEMCGSGSLTKLGEAELYLAELKADDSKVQSAWKTFSNIRPFQNEAGLVECTDWLLRHDTVNKLGPLKSIVKGVGHLFNVCRVLLDPTGQENIVKSRLFDEFYGFSPHGPTSLQLNRKEKPVGLSMIKDLLRDNPQKKVTQIEVPRQEAHEAIVGYLLRRAYCSWVKPVWDAVSEWRCICESCRYTVAGLQCPDQGNEQNPCKQLHRNQDAESFRKLISTDILLVELEHSLEDGAKKLLLKCRPNLQQTIESFLYLKTDPVEIRYQACKTLWNDIMPSIKYPACIGNEKMFIKYLSSHDHQKVRQRMYDFLMESWGAATYGEKKLKSTAVKSTEIFLLLDFGSRLFGLTENNRGPRIDPFREIVELEHKITMEARKKENIRIFEHKVKTYYTLMIDTGKSGSWHLDTGGSGNRYLVQCFGRRFSEAYTQMASYNADPYDAVYKFSKFCRLLMVRGDPSFLPELKHFLFWVEFYCMISFLIIAKVNWKNFPDFVFVVPDNYFGVVKFVEATFPKSTVDEVLGWWKPNRSVVTALSIQARLKFIVFLISGLGTNVKLFQDTFKHMVDPDEFAAAERLLVLGMTLICNVGKTVPVECEISLVKEICKLSVTEKAPQRLARAVESLKSIKGIKDVAVTLRKLLQERDNEAMNVCQWTVSGRIEKIKRDTLKNELLFSDDFLNPKTLPSLRGMEMTFAVSDYVKTADEGELSDDEIEKGRRDQEAHRQQDKRQKAASVIGRYIRQFLERRRKEKFAAFGYSKKKEAELAQMFEEIQVDAIMCGLCGFSFEHQMKGILDQEGTDWASGQLLTDRQNSSEEQGKTGTGTLMVPSSSEAVSDMQQKAPGDKSPDGKGLSGWVGSKIPVMQNPTKDPLQPWGNPVQQTYDLEHRKKLLEDIRVRHCKDQSHLQKRFEFQKFKKDYTEKIFPKVDAVKEFIYNPEYQLKSSVKDNFAEMRMDINRLFGMVDDVQRMVQLILAKKMWTDIGRLEQVQLL